MRHCLACHNLSSSLIEKASQYMFYTKGYLNYSLCLRKTCFDLLKVKNNLLDLFRTYCFFNKSPIRLSEIVFGSSVIFRAILTCSLVFNSLTRPESTEEEIVPKTPPSLPLATKSGPKFPAPEQQAPPMALSEKQRGKLPVSTTQPPSLSSASPRPLTSSQRDKQFKKKIYGK